ncbi:MAG: hypothetical protein IJU59_03710 [Firmicutes bacterium]|nr:hypothetical protein [Treponema sp.]MBQ7605572.1 hypothetical protein [Bacillota bacterium]
MKKMLLAVLAMMMTLTLTGCGDEDKKAGNSTDNKKSEKSVSEKDVKNFIPTVFPEEDEYNKIFWQTIEGVYSCDVNKFMKKTNGLLGKTDRGVFNSDGTKIDVPGIQVEIPSGSKKMYIQITDDVNGIVFDKDIEKIKNAKDNFEREILGAITGIRLESARGLDGTCKETNEIYLGKSENEIIFFGIHGTINGKEVIYNEDDKTVFTKENVDYIRDLVYNSN